MQWVWVRAWVHHHEHGRLVPPVSGRALTEAAAGVGSGDRASKHLQKPVLALVVGTGLVSKNRAGSIDGRNGPVRGGTCPPCRPCSPICHM